MQAYAKQWIFALGLMVACGASLADNRDERKAQLLKPGSSAARDAQKSAYLDARDNATLTLYFKSGASHQVRYDSSHGTLKQLSIDFAAYTSGDPHRRYTYRSVNATQGSISVDLDAVEGISEIFH